MTQICHNEHYPYPRSIHPPSIPAHLHNIGAETWTQLEFEICSSKKFTERAGKQQQNKSFPINVFEVHLFELMLVIAGRCSRQSLWIPSEVGKSCVSIDFFIERTERRRMVKKFGSSARRVGPQPPLCAKASSWLKVVSILTLTYLTQEKFSGNILFRHWGLW